MSFFILLAPCFGSGRQLALSNRHAITRRITAPRKDEAGSENLAQYDFASRRPLHY